MSISTRPSHRDDAAYLDALRHLQKGEWARGLSGLTAVADRFPHEPDLRAFIAETQVRAGVDGDEREDNLRLARQRTIRLATRATIAFVVLVMAALAVRSYANWFREQLTIAQQTIADQARAVQLAANFADAQAMVRTGRLEEAQALLDEIAAVDPAYPGLQMLTNQVSLLNTLDARYAEAIALVQAGDWAGAKPILQMIADADPNYRDVAQQLEAAELQLLLQETWDEAQGYYTGAEWAAAAAAFEGLRAIDPTYRAERVEELLFDSYVKAGQAALVDQADSLEALKTAEAYFRKALALRPQNPEIKAERELARLYLAAQEDFANGRWTDVIAGLEVVYAAAPDYANGSARQTLYEARVARGDAAMANQDYDAALSDYELAVALAEKDKSAVLRLYEAYLRAGDAHAAKKEFEAAALLYRKAIDVSDLRARAAERGGVTVEAIGKAEEAFTAANFALAYEQYRVAVFGAPEETQTTVKHVVQTGEYLILIATRYHSTVQAIVAANNIANPRLIYTGQELIIPVLP